MSWSQKLVENWWGCVVVGVAIFLLSLWERHQFLQLEAGETKFLLVDPITHAVYNVGGTGGVVVFGFVLACFCIGYGVYLFFKPR